MRDFRLEVVGIHPLSKRGTICKRLPNLLRRLRKPEFSLDGSTHCFPCYLEIVKHRRLVFTDSLGPGFRPKSNPFMTATVLFEQEGGGTRYTAIAMHVDEAGRKQHEEMGFLEGWAMALDQLVEYAKQL